MVKSSSWHNPTPNVVKRANNTLGCDIKWNDLRYPPTSFKATCSLCMTQRTEFLVCILARFLMQLFWKTRRQVFLKCFVYVYLFKWKYKSVFDNACQIYQRINRFRNIKYGSKMTSFSRPSACMLKTLIFPRHKSWHIRTLITYLRHISTVKLNFIYTPVKCRLTYTTHCKQYVF